jgi:hypothetical protein
MPNRDPVPEPLREALRKSLRERFADANADASGPNRDPVPDSILEALRKCLQERFADANAEEIEQVACRMERPLSPDFVMLVSEWLPEARAQREEGRHSVHVVAEVPWRRRARCPLSPPLSRKAALLSGLADLLDLFPKPRESFDRRAPSSVRELAAGEVHRAEPRSQRS